MKNQIRIATAGISRRLFTTFAMLLLLAIPVLSYSQAPAPPPPGPGGSGGGSPDQPLGGVPFDQNMTLAFLLVAIVFAVIILKRRQKKDKDIIQLH
jgi:hypothetical protein